MSTLRRLQVFADPIRFLLLDLLVAHGEMSTAQLGRLVPRARSGMTFHLEELEAIGAIEGHGEGRKRRWRCIELPPLELTDDEAGDDVLEGAVRNAERALVNRRTQRMHAWTELRRERQWDQWREAGVSRDGVLPPMEPEDLARLDELLTSAVSQFREELADKPTPSTGQSIFVSLLATPLLADDQAG